MKGFYSLQCKLKGVSPMYAAILGDATFFRFLLQIDWDLAAQQQQLWV